jgi:hypothetical protein
MVIASQQSIKLLLKGLGYSGEDLQDALQYFISNNDARDELIEAETKEELQTVLANAISPRRYLLFAWQDKPKGGWNDFVMSSNLLYKLKDCIHNNIEKYTYAHVVDTATGKIIKDLHREEVIHDAK